MHQTELRALPDTFLFSARELAGKEAWRVVKTLTGIIAVADSPDSR
jgi:hypothetical protein